MKYQRVYILGNQDNLSRELGKYKKGKGRDNDIRKAGGGEEEGRID